jgi:hypothetical protein
MKQQIPWGVGFAAASEDTQRYCSPARTGDPEGLWAVVADRNRPRSKRFVRRKRAMTLAPAIGILIGEKDL